MAKGRIKPITAEQQRAINSMVKTLGRQVEDFAFHGSNCRTSCLGQLSYREAAGLINALNDLTNKTT